MRIAMVAGEASGDLLAAHLIEALRRHLPEAHFYGIGGPKMQAAGFEVLWPSETLAVNGLFEVLRHYRALSAIRRRLGRRLIDDRPDVFIGIDAPDFNLGLEARLKRKGIPTVHYVSPSIWAWRGGRIKTIGESVSRILALFPFEPPLYRERGIAVSYVGHPLADLLPVVVDRAAAREKLDLPQERLVFALLPGSRQSEVARLAATFIETARQLERRFGDVLFLVPLISRRTREMFEQLRHTAEADELPMRVMFGHAQDAMAAADAVLVASGTATLEAALLKRPMVIAYKVAPATAFLMRRMGYLPYVGLPNILAGRFVVPEFLQEDCTADNLAQALGNLVCDRDTCARLTSVFTDMHHELRQNTAERAAQAILPMLGAAA
ncbi:MAG: lipid-A-disaccharide synthase [Sterolibacteriaceae bacterium]|nr:lipid-A-disaccharide synthase [Candidatus Methylophosphatis haderslevensis]